MVAIYQDKKADEATSELKSLQQMQVIVKRNGIWQCKPSIELVPGDIVQVKQGNKIYADCRLVQMKTIILTVNESSITGVKKEVTKEIIEEKCESEINSSNMLFSGTIVRTGHALAIVCRTGSACLINRISQDRCQEDDATNLEKKLDAFGKFLEIAVFYICIFIWVMNFTNFRDPLLGGFFTGCIYYLKIAVALAVAALPEGLPTVITACLALGTRRLSERKAIVKKLSSIEALGTASVICTSTAGLTCNQQVVSDFLIFDDTPGKTLRVSANPGTTEFANLSARVSDYKNIKQFVQALFVNNISRCLRGPDDPEVSELQQNMSFEVPTYQFVSEFFFLSPECKRKQDYLAYLSKKWSIKTVMPYDSSRRVMSTLAQGGNKGSNYLFIKGDPKALVANCRRVLLKDTTLEPIDDIAKTKIMAEIRKIAAQGRKVIAVAYKRDNQELDRFEGIGDLTKPAVLGMLKDTYNYRTIEEGCDLIGFIGIADPIRPEVKMAIQKCNQAGIIICLMSGNLQEAAEAYAKEMGLNFGLCISSNQLDELSLKELTAVLKDAIKAKQNLIFSSITELQKRKVVKVLQSLHQVVVVSGKDATDELAMIQADIPVAMGLSGTDGAKDKADIVLADDNFASIANSIEEGRGIYENMKVV